MDLADLQQAVGLKTPIRHQLFIDGRFVDAESGETLADAATRTTTRPSPTWRWPAAPTSTGRSPRPSARSRRGAGMAAADRGRILLKLADLIEANTEELARLESLDTGHPMRDSRALDVPRTAACFRYFGGMADKFQGDVDPGRGRLPQLRAARAGRRRRPDRAVELPADVHAAGRWAPALAAGNTHRAEAGRDHAADDAEDRRADGRGRHARRRGQHRARATAASPGQYIAEHPRRREDRLHRLDRDRPARSCRRQRRQPEEGAARARRQGRQHRVRRRRPRRPRSTARPGRSSTTRGRPASPARG